MKLEHLLLLVFLVVVACALASAADEKVRGYPSPQTANPVPTVPTDTPYPRDGGGVRLQLQPLTGGHGGGRPGHGEQAGTPQREEPGRNGAAARPKPLAPSGEDSGRSLTAARVCFLEAGLFRTAECRALVHVIRRRARRVGIDFDTMAWRYSALRAGSRRAAEARGLPDGDVPGWGRLENRSWARLRAAAAAVLAGRAGTPCGAADHWGSPVLEPDARRARRAVSEGRWVPVRCTVPTVNSFFRVVRD